MVERYTALLAETLRIFLQGQSSRGMNCLQEDGQTMMLIELDAVVEVIV